MHLQKTVLHAIYVRDFTILSPSLFLSVSYCLEHNGRNNDVLICIKRGRRPEMHTIKCMLVVKVSLLTLTQVMHNLWREIGKIQLMKCPLNFDCTTRQNHLGNPSLKHDTS